MKISLIQPGRNNLKYLKWAYAAIRKNQGNHEVEICVADDASTDGTWKWCQEMMAKDDNFKAILNDTGKRLGHTILYDRLVNEVATNDVAMIYHADMYLMPGALDAIEREIEEKTIVSLTRIEPPLHPDGPEKVLLNCGVEPEEFKEQVVLDWYEKNKDASKITPGIFAPWAFYRKDFQEIGGHDPLYAPQSKEDSDIFNRFVLAGYKLVQTREGCVYHMTCRGSRFADGAKRNPDGEVFMKNRETDEWLAQNIRSTRNFIRKWGTMVEHDEYLKPIITPKYDIGFHLTERCSSNLIGDLEPYCSNLYVDDDMTIKQYIEQEQSQTDFNLSERVSINELKNDVIVKFDPLLVNQQNFSILANLPKIIQDSGEVGEFELDIFNVKINKIKTYERDLINCNTN